MSNISSTTPSRYFTASIWRLRSASKLASCRRTSVVCRVQLAADDVLVQVLEHAVHAADARPLVRGFVGQRVGVVRLADVQQVERRLLLGEPSSRHHGAHVVVLAPSGGSCRSRVQHGARIQHRQRDHARGCDSPAFLAGKPAGYSRATKRFELDLVRAQPLVELARNRSCSIPTRIRAAGW